MLELALKLLIAYLLGSLMGALIFGALRGIDIRNLGSGNAGGTNALRTQGKWFALGVVLIDVSKGWFCAAILPQWPLFSAPMNGGYTGDEVTYACALAVSLGHVYPVWWEFRGGKGAATLIGVLLGAAPAALPPILVVWLITVMITGYVGLSTMLATIALPIVLYTRGAVSETAVSFAVVMAGFVVYTHRSNIARMLAGNENRARRIWLGSYFSGRRG